MKQRLSIVFTVFLLAIPMLGWGANAQEKKIIISGDVDGPWLGVQIEKISAKMLTNLGLEYGVQINKVIKDSPAEEAGLESDDILLTLDGEKLNDPDQLVKLVKSRKIDAKVKLEYFWLI